jgi:HK97 family phage prohead protease
MRTDVQLRYSRTDFEMRGEKGASATLVGHAAVFNSETVIWGLFREQIAPRAFRKSIKENDIRALFNHDTNVVLGRNKAGTLRLSEDATGLLYEIDLPDTQAARDLWTSIDRGDITQSSFAFDPVKELREEPDPEAGEVMPLITVKEARLYDVSPVTYPAYDDTDVSARVLMRCADLSGHTIAEVRAAWESGDVAHLWTPANRSEDTTPEPPEPPSALAGTPEPEPERINRPFPLYL